MLKLILTGVACLGASSKYYYDKVTNVHDQYYRTMSLESAAEEVRGAAESHAMRVNAWLKVVFQDRQIPFIEKVETRENNRHTVMYAMPVGKEYSQALPDSDPEFITYLDKLHTKGAEYSEALERALRCYLEKGHAHMNDLMSKHFKEVPLSTVYYDHTHQVGGAVVEAMLDNNGSYACISLNFCPHMKNASLRDKHGYLANLFVEL